MAKRWSQPSNSRFRVWPDPEDHYDAQELAQNWDTLDAILGAPSSGQWPPTEGRGGGIYAEVKRIKDSAIPLGAIFPWFRASASIPLPSKFAVCDGSTLTPAQHDWGTGANVVLPDLRNAFIMGADIYGKEGPTEGQTGGSNRHILNLPQMPAHKHALSGHTGWSPGVFTWYYQKGGGPGVTEQTYPTYVDGFKVDYIGSPSSHHSTGGGGWGYGQHRHNLTIASQGSDEPHENRPRYVGLIYIIKVKHG